MNVLLTGAWPDAESYIPKLEALGHNVQYMQYQDGELPCYYTWPEAVVCSRMFDYHKIEKFENLAFVQCTMAGIEHLPLDFIREHSINLKNASGVYSIPIAEYVICGILQLYKDSYGFFEKQKTCAWEKNRELMELTNKSAFVLGTGSIGCEIAKRLQVFGCKTIGFNRSNIKANFFDEVSNISEFKNMAASADIIIVALPLDNSTLHLINKDVLSSLKSSTVLVNVSRGAVVDNQALALQIGNIKGAVLDVFENEPLEAASPLWKAPNIIITPHNSFAGDYNNCRLNNLIMSNLQNL